MIDYSPSTQSALNRELLHWEQMIQRDPANIRGYIRRGMAHFKLGNIDRSIQDFDQAEQLDSSITPYLWQRGLSYYYADRFEAGAKQFEIDLTVNAHDVEETVWRFLCIAQWQGTESARKTLLPVKGDRRRVMRSVYDLFAGNCSIEDVLSVGQQEGNQGRFYSDLYVGLWFEAMGDVEPAKHHINRAVELFKHAYQTDDYMGYLAVVHQQVRQWQSTQ